MIYDGLSALGLYRGLSRGLDVLIDWLDGNDPASLPIGRTEILGEKVFANVMNARTRTLEDARFETHRRYMDVQMDLDGAEGFMTTPGEVVPDGEFDVSSDKGYCHVSPGNADLLAGTLEGGHFAVFVIGEPHMPNLVTEGAQVGPIKKICFKVVGDAFWDEVRG
jgi:biofilm protein TabA